jgi:hypothetical protein
MHYMQYLEKVKYEPYSRTMDAYVMRCSRMVIYKYHFLAQYKELRSPL